MTAPEVADRAASLRPSRRTTKRIVVGLLVWAAGLLTVIVFVGGDGDSRLLETIALGLMALIPSLVGFYIGGGAWDFRNVLKAVKER